MKLRKRLAGVVGLAMVAALTACASANGGGSGSATETPTVKVRYGSVGGMTDAPLYVAQDRGYFKDAGLEVEMTRLASGTDILAAMVGQSLDVGAIAVSAGLLNAVKDSDNYVFVADRQSQQGPEGFGEGFLASKKLVEGVDLEDRKALGQALKGKKVAITGLNTSTEFMVGELMKSYGISNDEVELVVLPFAQMAAAFQNGAIDAGIVLEPFRSKILESGEAVQISHLDGVISSGTQVPVTLTKQFASNKKAAGAFVEAYLKGVMDVTAALGPQGVDRAEIVKIIAKHSDLPEEVIEQSDPPGYGYKGPLNIEYMGDFQNFLVKKGVMPAPVDIAKAVDDSFAAAAPDVALTMENVSKVFLPKRGGAVLAMTDVSLTVRRDEVLAILGPSGCGKSTLLRIVGGLDNLSTGSMRWSESQRESGRLDAATVFQQDSTLPWLTVAQNIRLGLSGLKLTKSERNERVERYASLVGLHAFLGAYPHELSGGMRQRVAIARALASEPRLLLMDEPLAALDAQTRIVMQSELSTLWGRTGSTVVYVTHDIEEAITLADRIVVMSARPGRIKSERTVDFRPGARGEVDPVALRAIPEFGQLAADLWADLAEEVGDALSAKESS